MDKGQRIDGRPAGMWAVVITPTTLANLLASFLLLICVLYPHSIGDETTTRPLNVMMELLSEQNAILLLTVLWPYWFAGATLVVIITLAALRPVWYDKALLGLPTAFGLGLALLWTMLLFSRTDESRSAMLIAAIVAPVAACVIGRMVWLYRSGQVLAAASWGQRLLCVLSVFSLRWFWYPPVTRLLWGGILSIAASLAMMLATWTWVTRARHDLFDRSVAPMPIQVSLREIILGMTLVAIALAYWRVVAIWA